MQRSLEYLEYARECDRLAANGSAEHRAILQQMAAAWRQCAQEAERKEKSTEGPSA
jgi:hypothetical protein